MDKNVLFENRLGESEYHIEGKGTVKFRSLSRMEALQLNDVDSAVDREQRMLAWALTDPQLSYKDVERWQLASEPGEIEPLTEAIAVLSGMLEDSAKEATKSAVD